MPTTPRRAAFAAGGATALAGLPAPVSGAALGAETDLQPAGST